MSSELVPVGQAAAVVWSPAQVEILRDQMCAEASDAELAFFAEVAGHKGLDPFAGEIIAQMRYSKKVGRKVLVIQETVAGLRTIAERTGLYGGQDEPLWCGADKVWTDVWLDPGPPAACKVKVYRKDWAQPATGIATYASYVQLGADGRPQGLWGSGADFMLWKCAEAAALKRAFRRQLEDAGVNTREYTPPERVSMEARLAGLDDDDRHALVAEITDGRTHSTRDVDDHELLELRAEVARLRAHAPGPRSVTSAGPHGTETHWFDPTTGERVGPPMNPGPGHAQTVAGGPPDGGSPGPGPLPTAARGSAVDAPGPDQKTDPSAPTVDGPTPPASTSGAAVSGPGPDEPGYVDHNGRVHVPDDVRPDVAKLQRRIASLPPDEKEAVRAWLARAKIPDSVNVSEGKVRAVNAELDRRAAGER
jgi:phage recombination protein Bet